MQLHLLSDLRNRLVLRLDQRAALADEIARHLVQRILILSARRQRLVDEHVLMELPAAPQDVGVRETRLAVAE